MLDKSVDVTDAGQPNDSKGIEGCSAKQWTIGRLSFTKRCQNPLQSGKLIKGILAKLIVSMT